MVNDNILSYVRLAGGKEAFLVIVNLGTESSTDNYNSPLRDKGVTTGTIVSTTGNFGDKNIQAFNVIPLSRISLDPGQGLILKVPIETSRFARPPKVEL